MPRFPAGRPVPCFSNHYRHPPRNDDVRCMGYGRTGIKSKEDPVRSSLQNIDCTGFNPWEADKTVVSATAPRSLPRKAPIYHKENHERRPNFMHHATQNATFLKSSSQVLRETSRTGLFFDSAGAIAGASSYTQSSSSVGITGRDTARCISTTSGEGNKRRGASEQVFIALGSNIGDRFEAIESACRAIDETEGIRITETSPLYETEPMYVEDQDRFLNGVCSIETQLEPTELLNRLQSIENNLGRVKMIDKGPRNIDLDIVIYRDKRVETERLSIPHRLMLEREFVLRPLCDTEGKHYRHPETGKTAAQHIKELAPSSTPVYPLTSLGPCCSPIRSLDPKRKTLIMSILNVTPDSFSDGGQNKQTDPAAIAATAASHIAAGASIIDIGGQSSRPNAADITAEEELARVLPAIQAIKSLPSASSIAISIDTYRASVAATAVRAGAHIVNDISAGLMDPQMLPTVARLGCTYILMHMRGTPATMQSGANTSYPDGLLATLAAELRSRLAAAQQAGIRRWRIVLDPGVGFAKTVAQNVEILRRFADLRGMEGLSTYPWLVGSSRKGFIGEVTGVKNAAERFGGTAATVTAAIQGGAEIVRVHDLEEMRQVVRMADAMYRDG